ncbi:gag-polypeptide of LTR copia-type, partial [Phytophthora infestans]
PALLHSPSASTTPVSRTQTQEVLKSSRRTETLLGYEPKIYTYSSMADQGQAASPAAQAAAPDRRMVGSNKPPKYDEEGGFDLYKAMLRRREAVGMLAMGRKHEIQMMRTSNVSSMSARDAILRGVLTKYASRICNFDNAHETWDAFEREKTKRAFSNALMLKKKLYSYTYAPDMDMESYPDELEHTRRQLRNMNDSITDDEMVKIVLQGVAFGFRGVVGMYDKDVRRGNIPALQEVLNTLRSEAELDNQRKVVVATKAKDKEPAKTLQAAEQLQPGAKKREQHQPARNRRKFNTKRKEKPDTRECFHCGKKGHLKKNCFALRQETEVGVNGFCTIWWIKERVREHGETSISIGMGVDGSTLRDEWMIDTGAGVHVCNGWTAFTSLQEDTMSFVGWQGESTRSEIVRHVDVCTKDVKSKRDLRTHVMLAIKDECLPTRNRQLLKIVRCIWIVATYVLFLHKRSGHYWLQVKRATASAKMCMMTAAERQSAATRWHMKYAHLSVQALKQLVLKNVATGLKLRNSKSL